MTCRLRSLLHARCTRNTSALTMPAGRPGTAGLVRSALLQELICDCFALSFIIALELLALFTNNCWSPVSRTPTCHCAAAHRGCAAVVLELATTDINVASTATKYVDPMLMLMLMCMMVTLMLTPMVNVGILLERARKKVPNAGTAAGPCLTAGAAGSCDRKHAVASSCTSRTRTNPLEAQGSQPVCKPVSSEQPRNQILCISFARGLSSASEWSKSSMGGGASPLAAGAAGARSVFASVCLSVLSNNGGK